MMLGVLGQVLARAGQHERARSLLGELRQRLADGQATSADPGYVLAGLGELDEAMEMFDQASEACSTRLFFKVDHARPPALRSRFAPMLRRLRLE